MYLCQRKLYKVRKLENLKHQIFVIKNVLFVWLLVRLFVIKITHTLEKKKKKTV